MIVISHFFSPISFFNLFGSFDKFLFLLQSDLPVREKIFLLLDATQVSLGGASGKFPQYHAAYHDLVVSPNVQHV